MILVTGAAGFIGSHLAEKLTAAGNAVTGLDCLKPHYSLALKSLNVQSLKVHGVPVLPLDLARDPLEEALKGVQYVFHLAAQPGIGRNVPFESYLNNNLVATYRLLQAALKAPALRGFCYISTSSVYGANAIGDESSEPRPTSYYGVTKLAAEQLVMSWARDKGFPACSTRLFSVYGPRERPEKLFPQVLNSLYQQAPLYIYRGSLDHLRSYTYVGDITNGLTQVLLNFPQGEIINLGSEQVYSTREAIQTVESLVGKKAQITMKPRRPGDQLHTQARISKASALLNYLPLTSLKEGLAQEVNWYKEHILGKVDL